MRLRRFNRFGIRFFRFHLCEMRKCGAELDRALLDDPDLTEPFPLGAVELERREFASRKEWAEYLDGVFLAAGIETTVDMPGLWEWLALFYWEQVCKRNEDGSWDVRDDEKYAAGKGNRDHRNLLKSPYLLYREHKDVLDADVVLCQRLDEFGDVVEGITARERVRTSRAALKVAGDLFLDRERNLVRPSLSRNREGGGLRDFCIWLNSLPPQFDLREMDYVTLLLMLPNRFNRLLALGPAWEQAMAIRADLVTADVIQEGDEFPTEPSKIEDALAHLSSGKPRNSPAPVMADLFSAGTLATYGERCAISKLGLRHPVGKEGRAYEVQAAHIVPTAYGGPDSIRNGLTLSRTVRWAFDEGLIWVDVEDGNLVKLASDVRNDGRNEWLLQFGGTKLTLPSNPDLRPNPDYLEWHAYNVARH